VQEYCKDRRCLCAPPSFFFIAETRFAALYGLASPLFTALVVSIASPIQLLHAEDPRSRTSLPAAVTRDDFRSVSSYRRLLPIAPRGSPPYENRVRFFSNLCTISLRAVSDRLNGAMASTSSPLHPYIPQTGIRFLRP